MNKKYLGLIALISLIGIAFLLQNPLIGKHELCYQSIDKEDSTMSLDEMTKKYSVYKYAIVKINSLDYPNVINDDQKSQTLYYSYQLLHSFDNEEITYDEDRCLSFYSTKYVSDPYNHSVLKNETVYLIPLTDSYKSSYPVFRNYYYEVKGYNTEKSYQDQNENIKELIHILVDDLKEKANRRLK